MGTGSPGIDESTFLTAVGAAVRAPSLHNSQPWRFRLTPDGVDVCLDPDRTLPVADPRGWAARIAAGAATFNLRLGLIVAGCPVAVSWLPTRADPGLVAHLGPDPISSATPVERRLHAAIARRHSNRTPFEPRQVPTEARAELVAAAQAESAWLDLVTGSLAVAATAEITQAANRVLRRDEHYRAELARWEHTDDLRRDGVPTTAGGPTTEPQDLFPPRRLADPGLADPDADPEPLVAVLGTNGDSPSDELAAGYALQRVLLTVTDLGLAASLLSQPIEVAAAREHLRIALSRRGAPQMVLRIGYGQPAAEVTSRRPVTDVIDVVDVAGPGGEPRLS